MLYTDGTTPENKEKDIAVRITLHRQLDKVWSRLGDNPLKEEEPTVKVSSTILHPGILN